MSVVHRFRPVAVLAAVAAVTAPVLLAAPIPAAAKPAADTDPAPEARNEERAEAFIEEVYNERRLDRIPEYVAEEFVDRTPGAPAHARGPGFVRQQAGSTFAALPDIQFEILHLLSEGDLVTIHWLARGTASSRLGGAGAAGREVELQGISLFRYDDQGKVAESWDLVDRLGMMQQLGFELSPPPAPEQDGAMEPGEPGEGGDGR